MEVVRAKRNRHFVASTSRRRLVGTSGRIVKELGDPLCECDLCIFSGGISPNLLPEVPGDICKTLPFLQIELRETRPHRFRFSRGMVFLVAGHGEGKG